MGQSETQSINSVPSSLTQVRITMKYTFLEYFRSRRFLILLIITLLIAALLTILVAWRSPPSFLSSNLSFYSSWWGGAITFVIILSGIFFGGDAISGEFQNKTGYFGMPNPIRRSSVRWKVVVGFLSSHRNNGSVPSDYHCQWSLLFWLIRLAHPIRSVTALRVVLFSSGYGTHVLFQFAVQEQFHIYSCNNYPTTVRIHAN